MGIDRQHTLKANLSSHGDDNFVPGSLEYRLDCYRTDPAAAIVATLAEEKKTNPFLRVDSVGAFRQLRRAKDIIRQQ